MCTGTMKAVAGLSFSDLTIDWFLLLVCFHYKERAKYQVHMRLPFALHPKHQIGLNQRRHFSQGINKTFHAQIIQVKELIPIITMASISYLPGEVDGMA